MFWGQIYKYKLKHESQQQLFWISELCITDFRFELINWYIWAKLYYGNMVIKFSPSLSASWLNYSHFNFLPDLIPPLFHHPTALLLKLAKVSMLLGQQHRFCSTIGRQTLKNMMGRSILFWQPPGPVFLFPSRGEWSFYNENLDMSPFCKNLSTPFQDSTQQRSNFLTSCTKSFVVWFQPQPPAGFTRSQPTRPTSQSRQMIRSSLKMQEHPTSAFCSPCPFRYDCPSPDGSARRLLLTLCTFSQAKLHLLSRPWPLHISSELRLYLKPVVTTWATLWHDDPL